MPIAVERIGRDHARHERAVAVGVLRHGRSTNDLPPTIAAGELRVAEVDPRVDHRDLDRGRDRAARARSPRRGPAAGTTASPRAARCSRTRRLPHRCRRAASTYRAPRTCGRSPRRAARGRGRACVRPAAARRLRRTGPAARRPPSAPASAVGRRRKTAASATRAARASRDRQQQRDARREPAAGRPADAVRAGRRASARPRTSPAVSGVAVATVAHDAPLWRWSCTGGARQRGRTVPLTAPDLTVASTTGSTVRLTSARAHVARPRAGTRVVALRPHRRS